MADEYEYKDPNTDMMKALSKAVDAATGETGTQYEYKNPNTDVIQKLEELIEAIATSGGSHNYSTTEHVVGTWIDGKTVYEKTINVGTITTNTTVEHGITNLDRIISYEGFADYAGTSPSVMPIQGINPFYGFCMAGYDSTTIKLVRSNSLSSDYANAFVTIRYTKTST